MNTEIFTSEKEVREETGIAQQVNPYVKNPSKESEPQHLADYTEHVKEYGMNMTHPYVINQLTEEISRNATAINISQFIRTNADANEDVSTYPITISEVTNNTDHLTTIDESIRQPCRIKTWKSILLYVFSHILSAVFNPELFLISITALFFGPVPVFRMGLIAICVNLIETFMLAEDASLGNQAMLRPLAITTGNSKDERAYSDMNSMSLAGATEVNQGENIGVIDLAKNATWNAMPTSDGTLTGNNTNWFISNRLSPAFVVFKFIVYMSMAKELIWSLFSSDYRMLKGLAWMGFQYFGSDTLLGMSNTLGRNSSATMPSEMDNAAGGAWSFVAQNMLVLTGLVLPFTACIISKSHDYASIMSIIGSCCSAMSLVLILISNIDKTGTVDVLFRAFRTYNIYNEGVSFAVRNIATVGLFSLLAGLLYNHRSAFGFFRCLNILQDDRYRLDATAEMNENLEEVKNEETSPVVARKVTHRLIYSRLPLGSFTRRFLKMQVVLLSAAMQFLNLGIGCLLANSRGYLPPVAWRHLSWTGAVAQGLLALSATQRAAQCFMAYMTTGVRLNIYSASTSQSLRILAYLFILALTFLPISTTNSILSSYELIICGVLLPLFFFTYGLLHVSSRWRAIFLGVLAVVIVSIATATNLWFTIAMHEGALNETMVGVIEGLNHE